MAKSCGNCDNYIACGDDYDHCCDKWEPDALATKEALKRAVKDLEVARGLLPEHQDIKETVDYYIDKAVG